ncbi:MAG: MFS transporter [Rickettsiales bacterium]
MQQVLLSVSAVLAGAFLLLCGNGLLGTLLGVRLSMAAIEPIAIGTVMAAYFAGLLLGARYAEVVIRRFGHIRTFSALASIFSAATLVHAFFVEPITWGGLRFIEGFSAAGLFMCMESWLNDRAPNAVRGQVMSCYMIVVYAGLGLGQFLLLASEPAGFALFALTSVLVSLALVPVALTLAPAPELPEASAFGFRKLMEISPLGVVGAFGSGLVLGAVYSLAPSYTHAAGMDTEGTAWFMASVLLGGLLLQWPIGRLSDRFDRRKVIALVALATAAGSGAMFFVGLANVPLLMAVAAFFGGAIYLIYPLSVTHANDFLPPGDLVAASGGLLTAYGIGAVVGPLLASGMMSWIGPQGLFAFCGITGVAVAAFALFRIQRGRVSPEAYETHFELVPRTSIVAAELDPRSEVPEPELDLSGGPPAAPPSAPAP